MKSHKVIKEVLSNGLTILVKPNNVVPKVSIQLWYNVGSKDEKSGEKGIAHLIEHMIFKGTKKLSESDINLIAHKLSGYTNAFTSFDYTGYLFDFPSQQWETALTLLADCMHNATFKQSHLNSELKAVIQELKMYKDEYTTALIESMLESIFSDHPYHHPIIGYKQDLWSLNREALVNFYKKHYIPNNATLIIVGDIAPQEAIALAAKEFGSLIPHFEYKKEEYYHRTDLQKRTVTLYRDVQVRTFLFAWEVPGVIKSDAYLMDCIQWVIGKGKGSRLYKKLVDELDLVTQLDVFVYDLFDVGILFIYLQPKDGVTYETLRDHVHQELRNIVEQGISSEETIRAIKQTEVEYVGLLEENSKQAYAIGKFYLALGDENYAYTFTSQPKDHLSKDMQNFVASYLRPTLMHEGYLEQFPEEEKGNWLAVQDISDEEDAKILAGKERTDEVEPGSFVDQVVVYPPKQFSFPRAKNLALDNGLKVLYHSSSHVPKIDIILDFEADHQYDPQGKEGLSSFVAAMMLEGTKNYSAQEFAQLLEASGMVISSYAGQISLTLLAEDLPLGLTLLQEILVNATFQEDAIERVRARMISSLKEFWDTPMLIASQLVKEQIYKKHPYSKNQQGTIEGVNAVTREDIIAYYRRYISPRGARMALVGELSSYDLKKLLNETLQSWQGSDVMPLDHPTLDPIEWHETTYPLLRDQTVLCYAGLSVAYADKDYDKLLLFEQIFSGGSLNSMASRLFELREQSGLFYTIRGSLLSQVDKDRGMIVVKTIVSNDRLKEAEVAIEKTINTAIVTVSDDEFKEAQQAIINSLVTNFSTNFSIAANFLEIDRHQLPADFFDTRATRLALITKEEMQRVVKTYLSTDKFVLVRVGREAETGASRKE